jgi:hypothetical protein
MIAKHLWLNSSMISQHSKGSPVVVRSAGDEIVGPHVIRVLWP